MSVDARLVLGGRLGGGGGIARGAFTVGIGGGPLGGILFGTVGGAPNTIPASSRLESRACDRRASLCVSPEAISVS